MLQPTALVNEAFIRLLEWQPDGWQNRAQFFGVSVTLMRRIPMQFTRERQATKRGGHGIQVSLSEAAGMETRQDPDMLALDEALVKLEKLDPRHARIVELRFFGGLSLEEAGEVKQLSQSTFRHDLVVAKAWLRQQLSGTKRP